ncbi:MAG: MBL fold metallo-hydrolase [Deltaproteobacteria bacterium]|nr:MBL fold metallo-hydrolase [Deltaproteobacteria bacterium]
MNGITVRFLGSGDAFGSGGCLQPCIYVDTGDFRFLLDCGASSMTAMKHQGVDPVWIDAILLSHLHGDHFGGLPFFLLEGQLVSKRNRPLTVLGPEGTQRRVGDAMEIFFPGSTEMTLRFPLDYLQYTGEEPLGLGPMKVTAYPVVHASGAPPCAIRVECAGRVIAYSGDTEWTDTLFSVAGGADLFICEAYYFDKKMKYHLDYRTLMEHREALKCKRLILTHMSEDLLRHLPHIEAEWAEDGKCIFL